MARSPHAQEPLVIVVGADIDSVDDAVEAVRSGTTLMGFESLCALHRWTEYAVEAGSNDSKVPEVVCHSGRRPP